MVTLKFNPTELQFIIAALNNTQIYGKDAHVVSKCLNKFETKLQEFAKVETPK